MKSIEKLRENLSNGKYEISAHALKRAVERKILFFEIEEAGLNANLIEDYPDDKYSPSCLLTGYTKQGKALHLLVSRSEIDYVKIITVYEPDEDIFNGFERRK